MVRTLSPHEMTRLHPRREVTEFNTMASGLGPFSKDIDLRPRKSLIVPTIRIVLVLTGNNNQPEIKYQARILRELPSGSRIARRGVSGAAN